jgi:hypothetical protein
MGLKEVVGYFKILSENVVEEAEKCHEIMGKDSRALGQALLNTKHEC